MAAIRDGRGAWSGERCRSDQRQFTRRLALWQVILSVGLGRCRCPSIARRRLRLAWPKACALPCPSPPLPWLPSCAAAARCRRTVFHRRPARSLGGCAHCAATAACRSCCPRGRCACRPGPSSHRSARDERGSMPSEAGAAVACHDATPPGCPQLCQARATAHGCAACTCTSNPLVCVVCMPGQLDCLARVVSLWETAAAACDACRSCWTCSETPP